MAAPASPEMIALRGSPRGLVGRVPLANSGAERMLLRGGVLHVDGHDPIEVPLAVALRPGTTTDAPLRIDLGPSWPAGEVVGELEVGGTRVPVTMQVEPSISLDVSPDELLGVEGHSTAELTVHNDGNVTIHLAVRTRGRLLAHDAGGNPSAPGRPARVRESTGAEADINPEPGPQVECRLTEPVLLEPGASRRLSVQLAVPQGLDPTRRHRATVPIGPADLIITVLPTDPRDEGSGATT